MNREASGSRPHPFSISCSGNPAAHSLEIGKLVLSRNPEGTDLSAPGPHQLESCQNPRLGKQLKQTNKQKLRKKQTLFPRENVTQGINEKVHKLMINKMIEPEIYRAPTDRDFKLSMSLTRVASKHRVYITKRKSYELTQGTSVV